MVGKSNNENLKILITLTLAFDVIFIILHAIFGQYLGVFDLDREQNLPTVYQGFKLFIIALMLGVASWKVRNNSSQSKLLPALSIMSLAFAYLSFDEMFVISSSIWLLIYLPVLALGLLFMFYLKKLWPNFTQQQQKYIILGLVLLTSVVAIEFINSGGHNTDFEYYLFTTLEEALELFGATTFLYVAVLVAGTNKKS